MEKENEKKKLLTLESLFKIFLTVGMKSFGKGPSIGNTDWSSSLFSIGVNFLFLFSLFVVFEQEEKKKGLPQKPR